MKLINKILLIRFSSIGDILLLSPLIRALRNTFPDAQIDFVTKSVYRELLIFNPNISNVIFLETDTFKELRALRRRLHNERYDLVIDVHNSLRSKYIRYFFPGRIFVLKKNSIIRFMLVNFGWNFYREIKSIVDRYFDTVQCLKVNRDHLGLELYFPEDTIMSVKSFFERMHFYANDNKVVGFVPSAKHLTKRWLPERFVELGVRIVREMNVKILIMGGKEDAEYCGDIAQMINRNVNNNVAVNCAGTLSLLETASAFDTCDLVVSNDTGGMHIASARKRPIVAIFGPTVREFGFSPYGTKSVIIERKDLSCRPCSHIGGKRCPKKHFRCMRDIQVDDVFRAVTNIFIEN